MKITSIVVTPTWGHTLDLFQHNTSVKLLHSDSDKFRSILDAAMLKYECETDGEFTRFINPILKAQPTK
jgi:hypothetical protein